MLNQALIDSVISAWADTKKNRHSRAGGNPCLRAGSSPRWIPAYAGMTEI
jgi:hypothetical protein